MKRIKKDTIENLWLENYTIIKNSYEEAFDYLLRIGEIERKEVVEEWSAMMEDEEGEKFAVYGCIIMNKDDKEEEEFIIAPFNKERNNIEISFKNLKAISDRAKKGAQGWYLPIFAEIKKDKLQLFAGNENKNINLNSYGNYVGKVDCATSISLEIKESIAVVDLTTQEFKEEEILNKCLQYCKNKGYKTAKIVI